MDPYKAEYRMTETRSGGGKGKSGSSDPSEVRSVQKLSYLCLFLHACIQGCVFYFSSKEVSLAQWYELCRACGSMYFMNI